MSTWICKLDEAAPTPGAVRVAVKDAIDVVGAPTTAGCPQVAATALPAAADAACLSGFRAAGAHLVGKANLHELCFGISGANAWSGTPVNPFDPTRIPGGSSSGSAVALANGEVDVALGTDTGGSVRLPAACCGIVGLKTTIGRISTAGVWPVSASLDTVGPMARDVAGVVAGMALLEPGFAAAATPGLTIGRVRRPGVDPAIEAAIDAALAAAELTVIDVELPGWDATDDTFRDLILGEMYRAVGHLLAHDELSSFPKAGMIYGSIVTDERLAAAKVEQAIWQAQMAAIFERVEVLALPVMPVETPTFDEVNDLPMTDLTAPINVAGNPGLSIPLRVPGRRLPTGLQLVGPHDGEAILCATGAVVEAATA